MHKTHKSNFLSKISPIFGNIFILLTLNIRNCNILPISGNSNLLILQIEESIEPIEEAISQENHVLLILDRLDVSIAVGDV